MTTPVSRLLQLESAPSLSDGCWSIRLPLRAEYITLSKEVVVCERVRVRRRQVEQVARVRSDLRRERLQMTEHGDVRTQTSARA